MCIALTIAGATCLQRFGGSRHACRDLMDVDESTPVIQSPFRAGELAPKKKHRNGAVPSCN